MKKILSTLATVVGLSIALTGTAHAAGPASLTMSPSSGTYTKGNSFTVQITESGADATAVTVKLSFDSSKLSCVSAGGSSNFANTIEASCGNGTVAISRYNMTPTSGVVGSVTFSTVATGSASVNFAGGTQVASNGSNLWNGNTSGGTYTINAPATSTPTTGGSTSTGSTGGSSSSSSNSSAVSKKTATTATGATATASNGSNSTSSNGTESTAAANTEVKGDSTEKKAEDNKKSDDKKQTKAEDGSNLLVRLFTLLIAGLAAFFAGRYVARYMANRNKQTKTPLAEAVVAAKAADKKSAAKKKPATKKTAKKAKK